MWYTIIYKHYKNNSTNVLHFTQQKLMVTTKYRGLISFLEQGLGRVVLILGKSMSSYSILMMHLQVVHLLDLVDAGLPAWTLVQKSRTTLVWVILCTTRCNNSIKITEAMRVHHLKYYEIK